MPETIGLAAVLDLTDFNRGVDRYINAIEDMNGQTQSFASSVVESFAGVGKIVSVTAGILGGTVVAGAGMALNAIDRFASTSVQESILLEDQLASIAAVLGKSVEEVEPLRLAIQELAIDPRLKVDSFETAEAMELLARNGLELTQIMGDATRATIAMANATGGDFASSAALVTDILNIFGEKAGDVGTIVGQATAVVNNSKFDLNDYQFALGNTIAVAENAGLSFEDLNAGLVGVSSAYKTGRQAGTAFATMLTNFVPKSKQAAQIMGALGFITEQGTLKMYDAEGAFLGLENAADVLQGALGGLSDAERVFFIRQLFGIETQEAVIRLMELGADGIRAIKEEMSQVDAFKAAETRMQTLGGQLEVLDGILEALRINFGFKLIPSLTRGVSALNDVLEENFDQFGGMGEAVAAVADKLVDRFIPLIQDWIPKLGVALESVAAWILEIVNTGKIFNSEFANLPKPIQQVINFLDRMVDVTGRFITRMLDAMDVVSRVLKPFTDWLRANIELEDVLIGVAISIAAFISPLIVGIAKLGAFATAALIAIHTIREAWVNDWGDIRGFTEEVIDRVIGITRTLLDIVGTLLERFGGVTIDSIESAFIALQPIILGVLDAFQVVLDNLLLIAQGDWEIVWERVKVVAQRAIEEIPLLAQEAWDNLRPVMQAAINDVIAYIQSIDWAGLWEEIVEQSQVAWEFIYAKTVEVLDRVTDYINSIDWESIWQDIVDTSEKYWGIMRRFAEKEWARLVEFIKETDWSGIWKSIEADLRENFPKTFEVIDDVLQKVSDTVEFVTEKFEELRNTILDHPITKWLQENVELSDVFIALGLTMTTFGVTLSRIFAPFILTLGSLTLAVAAIRTAWETDWGGIRGFVDTTVGQITDIYNKAVELGRVIWQTHGSEILDILEGAFVAIQGVVTGALSIIQELLGVGILAAQGDWEGAWNKLKEIVQPILMGIADFAIDSINGIIRFLNEDVDWAAVWEVVKKVAIVVWNGIVSFIKAIDWASVWELIQKGASALWEGIKFIAEWAWGEIKKFIEDINWEEVWRVTKEIAQGIWTSIKEWAIEKWTEFKDWVSTINWDEVWADTKDIAQGIWTNVKEWAIEKWDELIVYLEGIDWDTVWTDTKKIAQGVWTTIYDWSKTQIIAIVDWIEETDWEQVWADAKKYGEGVWSSIKTTFDAFSKSVGEFFSPGGNGYEVNLWFKETLPASVIAAQAAVDNLSIAFQTLSSIMGNVFSTGEGGIAEAIRKTFALADYWVAVFIDTATTGFAQLMLTINALVSLLRGDTEGARANVEQAMRLAADMRNRISRMGEEFRAREGESIARSTGSFFLENLGFGEGQINAIFDSLSDRFNKAARESGEGAGLFFNKGFSEGIELDARSRQEVVGVAFYNAGQDATKAFANSLGADQFSSVAVEEWIFEVTKEVYGLKDNYSESGRNAVIGMANELADRKGISIDAAERFAEAVITGITGIPGKYGEIGVSAVNSLGSSIQTETDRSVSPAVQRLTRVAEENGVELNDIFASLGVSSIEELSAKMGATTPQAINAVTALVTQMITTGVLLEKGFVTIGEGAIAGLATKITQDTGIAEKSSIDMANAVIKATRQTFGSQSPSKEFSAIAKDNIEGFTNAWEEGWGAVLDQTKAILDEMLTLFDSSFRKLDQTVITHVRSMQKGVISEFDTLQQRTVSSTSSWVGQLLTKYQSLSSSLISTIREMIANIVSQFTGMITSITSTINTNSLFQTGVDLVGGFISGIGQKINEARDKVTELGSIVASAMGLSIEAQSDSKVFYRYGQWSGSGYIHGLEDTLKTYMQNLAQNMDVPSISPLSAATVSGPTIPSTSFSRTFSTQTENNNSFGPFYVQNGMDDARLVHLIRKVVDESI